MFTHFLSSSSSLGVPSVSHSFCSPLLSLGVTLSVRCLQPGRGGQLYLAVGLLEPAELFVSGKGQPLLHPKQALPLQEAFVKKFESLVP